MIVTLTGHTHLHFNRESEEINILFSLVYLCCSVINILYTCIHMYIYNNYLFYITIMYITHKF